MPRSTHANCPLTLNKLKRICTAPGGRTSGTVRSTQTCAVGLERGTMGCNGRTAKSSNSKQELHKSKCPLLNSTFGRVASELLRATVLRPLSELLRAGVPSRWARRPAAAGRSRGGSDLRRASEAGDHGISLMGAGSLKRSVVYEAARVGGDVGVLRGQQGTNERPSAFAALRTGTG